MAKIGGAMWRQMSGKQRSKFEIVEARRRRRKGKRVDKKGRKGRRRRRRRSRARQSSVTSGDDTDNGIV